MASSKNRFSSQRLAWWLSWLVLCSCTGCLPPLDTGQVSGIVVGSEPIQGATVQLWVLNIAGRSTTTSPIALATSQLDGTFSMTIDLEKSREFIDAPFLLLNAHGGSMGEDMQPAPSESSPMSVWAVIRGDSLIGPYTGIVLSPLTTVARDLGNARLAQGKAATYVEATEQAHQLIGQHFRIDDITRYGRSESFVPSTIVSPLDGDMYYSLILQGMSSLVHEQTAGQYPDIDIFALMHALAVDAGGSDAIFDGIGADGVLAVMLDSCAPDCQLSPDTLRTDLVRALARGYLRSPDGAGVNFGDAASRLLAVATSTEPELFGDALPAPLDDEAPRTVVQESWILDERLDSISFDSETLAPRHSHGTEAVDLAQGFEGGPCPEVYKHVNLMDSPEDNPLRLRYRISDDTVGIDDESVFAVLTVESTGEEVPVPVRVVRAPIEGWREYEIMLLRDQVPALARREGMIWLTIHASDWLGNSDPVSTCWIHTPLAPPVWVSEPRVADQADSLAAVALAGDEDNLAPLLNGVPLDLGKTLMEFEIANGTDQSAYVTLSYSQPDALYSKSWTDTYTVLYELRDTSCIPDRTCVTDPNLDIRTFHSIRGEVAALITGIRVWDVTLTPAVEVFPCNDCDANEYHIESRLANGTPRRYRVALVTTHLPELAPVDSGEPPMTFVDLPIHPVYQPMIITGHVGQTLSACLQSNVGQCLLEGILQSYRALTEASIVAGMLEARGQLSAAPDLSLHVPRPNPHTFGQPVRVFEYQWFTLEDPLPPAPLTLM